MSNNSVFLVIISLFVCGITHKNFSQSVDLSDSMLLKTYENGYRLYVNECNNQKIDAFIRNGLERFNIVKNGKDTYQHCTVVALDKAGEVIGGVNSDICRNEIVGDICLLHFLWVDEQHRRQGLGRKLMNTFMHYVASKNCSLIQLEAHEFQGHAKEFFENMEFATAATVPNPDDVTGFEAYIMRKSLDMRAYMNTEVPVLSIDEDTGFTIQVQECWNVMSSDVISSKVEAYNAARIGTVCSDQFALFLVSQTNEIIAGALGFIQSYPLNQFSDPFSSKLKSKKLSLLDNCCTLNIMWVDEEYRGRGLGAQIINELAEYSKIKACKFIQLETYEWQARGFYEKSGFVTVATVPNPEKFSEMEQYYMRKYLNTI